MLTAEHYLDLCADAEGPAGGEKHSCRVDAREAWERLAEEGALGERVLSVELFAEPTPDAAPHNRPLASLLRRLRPPPPAPPHVFAVVQTAGWWWSLETQVTAAGRALVMQRARNFGRVLGRRCGHYRARPPPPLWPDDGAAPVLPTLRRAAPERRMRMRSLFIAIARGGYFDSPPAFDDAATAPTDAEASADFAHYVFDVLSAPKKAAPLPGMIVY